MQTINSTEPMPHTPQGANGEWVWDEHTTARHVSADGHEWILRGAWRWQQVIQKQDAFTENASVKQIVEFHKPIKKIETKSFAAEKAGKALLVATAIITVLTIGAILAL